MAEQDLVGVGVHCPQHCAVAGRHDGAAVGRESTDVRWEPAGGPRAVLAGTDDVQRAALFGSSRVVVEESAASSHGDLPGALGQGEDHHRLYCLPRVCRRTRPRRPGPRAPGMAMAYKLIKAAQSQVEGRQPAASGGVRPRERTVPQGRAPRTACRHHPGTVIRHAGVPGRLTTRSTGLDYFSPAGSAED